jgi:hypothetical protein
MHKTLLTGNQSLLQPPQPGHMHRGEHVEGADQPCGITSVGSPQANEVEEKSSNYRPRESGLDWPMLIMRKSRRRATVEYLKLSARRVDSIQVRNSKAYTQQLLLPQSVTKDSFPHPRRLLLPWRGATYKP